MDFESDFSGIACLFMLGFSDWKGGDSLEVLEMESLGSNEADGVFSLSCRNGSIDFCLCMYTWYPVAMNARIAREMTSHCKNVFRLFNLSICFCIWMWFMVNALMIALCRTFSLSIPSVQRCERYFCNFFSDAFRISPVSKALSMVTLRTVRSISSLSLIFSPITTKSAAAVRRPLDYFVRPFTGTSPPNHYTNVERRIALDSSP